MILYHIHHIISCKEVRNASKSFVEGKVIVIKTIVSKKGDELTIVLERSVNLLNIGKDDFGIESTAAYHLLHIITRDEVGNSSIGSPVWNASS